MVQLAVLIAAVLSAAPPKPATTARAPKTVSSPLGFELTLPGDFEQFAAGEDKSIRHAWVRRADKPDFEQVSVQAYPASIGRGCPPADKLPAGITQLKANWEELPVCGMRMERPSAAGPMVVLVMEIPLASAGIALQVTGYVKNEAALGARLDELLKSVKGKTNWRAYFGCLSVVIPEGWGRLKSPTDEKILIARRATLMLNGKEVRPQFSITTRKNGPVTLEKLEASALAETKELAAKGAVDVQRIQLAGRPASELRWTRVDQGVTFKERMIVIPSGAETHLIAMGSPEAAAAEVQPAADLLVGSARSSCAP